MKKLGLLFSVLLIACLAGGAWGQGGRGHGRAAGNMQGAGAPGHGSGWQSGGWRGGGQPGHWRGGGGWNGWAGGFGSVVVWGAYPYYLPGPRYYAYPSYYAYPGYYGYPGYYPYPGYNAYPGYSPYPIYVDRGPTVYIQKPPVVATAPAPPVARAPAPAPAPRFERYTLSAKEVFAFDRADLVRAQPKLDEIAVALVRNPQITGITITGYTDRLGSENYNLRLSQRRADAVKAYVVGKGVAAHRLVAIGRGEANPVVQCRETAMAALIACLEPNRRVEIEAFTIERPAG